MNKILLLVTTYCVSSSFVSPSGVRAPSNPLGPTYPDGNPVIPTTGPIPVRPAVEVTATQFQSGVGDSFTGIISLSPMYIDVQLDRPINVAYVVFTNENSGSTFTQYVNCTTSAFNLSSGCDSNGRWRIELVDNSGQHYIAYIMVNNQAFGPLVPCNWFED